MYARNICSCERYSFISDIKSRREAGAHNLELHMCRHITELIDFSIAPVSG